MKIAIAGKGGTGKTTIAGMLIHLLALEDNGPILAVDADPNANLNQMLGLKLKETIGRIREEILDKGDNLPQGMPKQRYLEYRIQSSLVETKDVDLLVMGRPEGEGCYCYANRILSECIRTLANNYQYLVVDNQAGMEHLSRKNMPNMDILLIVADPTQMGIITATRIRDLVEELKLNIGHIYLVVNRVVEGFSEQLKKKIESLGLQLIATIPEDPLILEYELREKPLTALPTDSSALSATKHLLQKLVLSSTNP